MSVICMRDLSSLVWACTAKMLTWLVSRSSPMTCGRSVSGRVATSSSTHALYGAANFFERVNEGGGDLDADLVRDHGDFFRWLYAQADLGRRCARPE